MFIKNLSRRANRNPPTMTIAKYIDMTSVSGFITDNQGIIDEKY